MLAFIGPATTQSSFCSVYEHDGCDSDLNNYTSFERGDSKVFATNSEHNIVTITILIHRKVLASRFMKIQHVRHDVSVCMRLTNVTYVRKKR